MTFERFSVNYDSQKLSEKKVLFRIQSI